MTNPGTGRPSCGESGRRARYWKSPEFGLLGQVMPWGRVGVTALLEALAVPRRPDGIIALQSMQLRRPLSVAAGEERRSGCGKCLGIDQPLAEKRPGRAQCCTPGGCRPAWASTTRATGLPRTSAYVTRTRSPAWIRRSL